MRAHACELMRARRGPCHLDPLPRWPGPARSGRVRPSVQPLATPPDPALGPPISPPRPGGVGKKQESRRAPPRGGPYTHTGLRAAPVSFSVLQRVLKRWKGGHDGRRGRRSQGVTTAVTPPLHRFHDHRRGRRSHVTDVTAVPRGRARTVKPPRRIVCRRVTGISLHQKDFCRLTKGMGAAPPPGAWARARPTCRAGPDPGPAMRLRYRNSGIRGRPPHGLVM